MVEQHLDRVSEVEEQFVELAMVEKPAVSAEAPSSEIPSMVQLTHAIGIAEDGELIVIPPPRITSSPPSHFSSESVVPLSQWLPGYFFFPWVLGGAQRGPLHVQMMFMQISQRGSIFQGSTSSPIPFYV